MADAGTSVLLEQAHVEYSVNLTRLWQLQLVGHRTYFLENVERPSVTHAQLERAPGAYVQVLGVQHDLITNFKCNVASVSVCKLLVSVLRRPQVELGT